MAQKTLRSIEGFGAAVKVWGIAAVADQERQVDKSAARAQKAVRSAEVKLAGPDRTLSGSKGGGRSAIRLGHKLTKSYRRGAAGFELRATGAWQIRDNSARGGNTAPHRIGPRGDRNPRPLGGAKGRSQALKFSGGGLDGEFGAHSPMIPKKGINSVGHPGSSRRPAWAGAIKSVQPRIIEEHLRTFNQTTSKYFG